MAEFHEIAGYEVLSTLGHGARSTIYEVCGPDRETYALKRVVKTSPADQRFMDQAISEHEVAKRFDHETLRRSHKLIRHRNFIRTSEVLVLMEMVYGVTLEQHQPPRMVDMVKTCLQVAHGLAAMHALGFVHADIKPNNIMITKEGVVKIIDFGQSCRTATIKERIQGTPDYIAPEQVHRKMITPQTDVFNLGATLYWLLTRKHVPTMMPRGHGQVGLRIETSCPPPIELNPEVPPALSSLVMDCVERRPQDRPHDMDAVIDRLELAAAQLDRRSAESGVRVPKADEDGETV